MKEPIWLQLPVVTLVHKMVIREHGGLIGIRDEGVLESALARPINLYAYERPSLFKLAAAYSYGIARNHPFLDGNKRTAFMSAFIFLECNGHTLKLPEAEVVILMQQLAAGKIEEEELAYWLTHSKKDL